MINRYNTHIVLKEIIFFSFYIISYKLGITNPTLLTEISSSRFEERGYNKFGLLSMFQFSCGFNSK
jgi:hypothetical protein